MATRVPARLTVRQGRRFGSSVGGAFLVLAAMVWWRDLPDTAVFLAALGGGLALAGLVVPTRLSPIERAWMALAQVISRVTTPLFMGVVYFMVLTPCGLLRCVFGGNPLIHAPTKEGYWKERPAAARRSASMERQF